MTTPVARRAARVLLIDAAGRVLLFRGGDPVAPERGTWWFTPGGGLDPGESHAEAAARELFEETGLLVPSEQLGDCVHRAQSAFSFAGQDFEQDSCFFLLRVEAHEVDTAGFQELEAASIVEHRWWSAAELRELTDALYPPDLPDVLGRLGV
jgi:8-oxo-dGTP pyrophosphatase MutT (NUDIX family)